MCVCVCVCVSVCVCVCVCCYCYCKVYLKIQRYIFSKADKSMQTQKSHKSILVPNIYVTIRYTFYY